MAGGEREVPKISLETVERSGPPLWAFLAKEWDEENRRNLGTRGRALGSRKQGALVAREGDRIVGAATYKIRFGVGHLSELIVAKDRRGRGVGSALLASFQATCIDEGCHKLTLRTYAGSRAARFYERHGYHVEGFLRNDIRGLDMVSMAKFAEAYDDHGA